MGGEEIIRKLVARSNKPNRKSRSGQMKLATRSLLQAHGFPRQSEMSTGLDSAAPGQGSGARKAADNPFLLPEW